MAKYGNIHGSLIAACKALSDGTRLRAWVVLQKQELCACQLIELLQLAPSTISRHLSVLKHAGLIDSRKQGRWVYYRSLTDDRDDALRSVLVEMLNTLAEDNVLRIDQKRMDEILRMDPEELCRKQCL